MASGGNELNDMNTSQGTGVRTSSLLYTKHFDQSFHYVIISNEKQLIHTRIDSLSIRVTMFWQNHDQMLQWDKATQTKFSLVLTCFKNALPHKNIISMFWTANIGEKHTIPCLNYSRKNNSLFILIFCKSYNNSFLIRMEINLLARKLIPIIHQYPVIYCDNISTIERTVTCDQDLIQLLHYRW